MNRMQVLVKAVLFSITAAAAAQPNLLDDAGFSQADGGTLNSNSAWTLTANMPDGVQLAAQFQEAPWASDPADAGNIIGVWFKSFLGGVSPGDPLAEAHLSQVVPDVAGGDYTLEFSVRREANFLAGSWIASLSSDGTGGMDQLDLLAGVPNDGAWTQRTLTLFGVTPGDDLTVEVEMVDGAVAVANPQSAMVDDFALRSVGEAPVVAVPTLSLPALSGLALLLSALGLWQVRR